MMRTVLVTGAAGFVGFHLAKQLALNGFRVVALDEFNAYYEPALKEARARRLLADTGVAIQRMDVADAPRLAALVEHRACEVVVHLAAQAGVRHSIDHPFAYQHANIAGHLSVLEACRHASHLPHLIYASSSSVYGERPLTGQAFRESDPVNNPVSLYAATKRAGELLSDSYAHLYGLPQTGLRFFTVYGPWGRPDMAYFSFARRIVRGEPIELYGAGRMQRDFTYVDDVIQGIMGVLGHPPARGEHRILNIGKGEPRSLTDFVSIIERACGKHVEHILREMQPGDVTSTFADTTALRNLTGYAPSISLEAGIGRFIDWLRRYEGDRGSIAA